jgi:hypothetical protein
MNAGYHSLPQETSTFNPRDSDTQDPWDRF